MPPKLFVRHTIMQFNSTQTEIIKMCYEPSRVLLNEYYKWPDFKKIKLYVDEENSHTKFISICSNIKNRIMNFAIHKQTSKLKWASKTSPFSVMRVCFTCGWANVIDRWGDRGDGSDEWRCWTPDVWAARCSIYCACLPERKQNSKSMKCKNFKAHF